MAEQYKTLYPVKFYRDCLSHDIRPDGRKFDDYRPIIVNLGSISTSDGSALVKVGKTTVICGIKAELCQPKSSSPNEGFLVPNVELTPLCSPRFRPGPPTEEAQVLTQLVADVLQNSQCLDVKTLCLFPDKLAWCLFADLICLDYDGSLIDACVMALMAALKSLTLPSVEYDPALDNKQVKAEDRKPLKFTSNGVPCSTSFAVFDNHIVIDPTVEEEDLATSQITVVVLDQELCFVHKPGGTSVSNEELLRCIESGKRRAVIVEDIINTALKSL